VASDGPGLEHGRSFVGRAADIPRPSSPAHEGDAGAAVFSIQTCNLKTEGEWAFVDVV
jgi:hypothetical protein